MRFILLLLPFFSITIFGQTRELIERHYPNGQISSRGYDTCYRYISNKNEISICNTVGFYEVWYENGTKRHELFFPKERKLYINMWLPDGKQILKNGTGSIYETEPGYYNSDSLVFSVKDSVKHGRFNRYRSRNNSAYYWVQSGQYEKNNKTGLWIFRDSILNIYHQSYYEQDKQNGPFKSLYLNGKTKEEGQYLNGYQEGLWKYYDKNGILLKECGFRSGREFGVYKEYYPNGQVKISGQHTHISGLEICHSEDPNNPGEIINEKIASDNIVVLDGEWKYYNKDGEITKVKTYKKRRKK